MHRLVIMSVKPIVLVFINGTVKYLDLINSGLCY